MSPDTVTLNPVQVAAPPRPPATALRPPALHGRLLLQSLFVTVPAMAALAAERPTMAGTWLVTALLLMLGWLAVQRNRYAGAALLMSVMPPMMMLREFPYPFNTPAVLMAAMLVWMLSDGSLFRLYWSNTLLKYLSFCMIIYWAASFMVSGDYALNLRAVDLALATSIIYLLASRRSYLATMLVAFGLAAVLVGAAFLPQEGRLGAAQMEEGGLGNPILLGIPCALAFLISMADEGRWLLLDKRPWLRYGFNAAAAVFLFLSTSRGGWFIAFLALLVMLLLDRASRPAVARAAAVGTVLFAIVLTTPAGATAARYFDKLVSPDRTIAQRTTGRSEQWFAFPEAFLAAPIFGHGPGEGRTVSAAFAQKNIVMHALYLQVGVELGLFGLVILFIFLGRIWTGAYAHWRSYGESLPAVALVGFCVIGLSVSALDAMSGVYLGLAFGAAHKDGLFVVRTGFLREQAIPAEADASS